MKLLSIAIPCYNSQDYMENCIESLLVGGEEVEILVIDDGSSDRTAEIADAYARKYPTIVKAISSGKRRSWRSCQCRNQKCYRIVFQGSGQ